MRFVDEVLLVVLVGAHKLMRGYFPPLHIIVIGPDGTDSFDNEQTQIV